MLDSLQLIPHRGDCFYRYRHDREPPWVKPHTIVVHMNSGLLFVVLRVQQDRKTQSLWLSDGGLDGSAAAKNHCYPLEECDRGSINHFQLPQTVWERGMAISIPQIETYLVIEEGRLIIAPVYSAAVELAKAFEGVVVEYCVGS